MSPRTASRSADVDAASPDEPPPQPATATVTIAMSETLRQRMGEPDVAVGPVKARGTSVTQL